MWVVLAAILKVIITVKKYAGLASALQNGKPIEGLITSFLVQEVVAGLVEAGVPVNEDYFIERAEQWADDVLKEAESTLAQHSLVIAPDKLRTQFSSYLIALLGGKAVAHGSLSHRNIKRSADPVLLARGEFEREVTDLQFSGAGIDFAFVRTYRSAVGYIGPLGKNWDHCYNLRLHQQNEYVLLRLTGKLAEDRFVQHPRFGEADFSYYVPPDGLHDVIVPDGLDSFILKRPQGLIFRYEATDQPGEHRIQRIEDRFGNFLAFEYSQEDRLGRVSVNTTSRYVDFTYDDAGKITRIVDHAGRVVEYSYDDWGYLYGAAGPALPGEKPAKLERYEYGQVGGVRKLVRVWDRNDRIPVENEYEQDALSDYFGYISRQTENRGETTFFYEAIREAFDPSLPEREVPTLRVWESWRNGHQVERIFNQFGNELLTREHFVEGCRFREAVSRFRYNADGQIIARLDPDGTLTQSLYARDHLAASFPWPDADPVLGDIPMSERMGFGSLLATVTRAQRVALSSAPFDPGFWEQSVPSVKMPDHPEDVVVKYRFDRDSQLLTSISDPRYTASADPLHVESSGPGDPIFNPADPQFVAHQRHLTRLEYGPGPRFELQRTLFPDRTRPSMLDGITNLPDIVEQYTEYDPKGRLLERIDVRGYRWFNEYYDPVSDAKAGYPRRVLKPHLDLILNNTTPDILEIQNKGEWKRDDGSYLSSGTSDDAITITAEGVRIALFQSASNLSQIISTNPQVKVVVDGIPRSPWDQSIDPVYIIPDLSHGVHNIQLGDIIEVPFAIGRVQSHVSVDYQVDDLGNILQETDESGHMAVYDIDVLGRRVKVKKGPTANPSMSHFEYDPDGHVIVERKEWRDEMGQSRPEVAVIRRYHYDQAGLLLSESAAPEQGGTKRITRYHYDPEDNLREVINPRGTRTYFDYDALSRQIRIVRAACSPDCSVTEKIYDLADRVRAERDPRGAVYLNGHVNTQGEWQSGIDTRGQVRVKTNALGHMMVTDHDARDQPTIIRIFQHRSDGQFEMLSRRESQYDEHGDLIRTTDAVLNEPILTANPVHSTDVEFLGQLNAGIVQSAVTESHLDATGNLIAARDPVGGIQRQRFDGQDRWYERLDSEGRRTFRIFDGNGNLVRLYSFEPVRDPLSGKVLHHEVFFQTHEYDELDRQIALIDSYGNRWQFHYDSLGRKTRIIDPLGNVVRYDYNAFDDLVTSTQELTQTGLGGSTPLPALVTRREYDENGNITTIIDTLQRRIEFRFDRLDRLVETWFDIANEPQERRRYDPADNLVSVTDRNGLVRTMQYDLLNRHIHTDIDASSIAPGNELAASSASFVAVQYDAAGAWVRQENDHCVIEIRRDSRGLPISETITIKNIVSAPGPLEILRQFDLAGRRTRIIYPSGREISYSHDLLGRVTSVHNAAAPADYPGRPSNAAGVDLARYTYVGRRLVQADLANQLKITYHFDGRGYVLEQSVTGSTGTLWRMQQLRDAAGYVRLENAVTRTGARSRKFALDSIYRLTHYHDDVIQWLNPALLAPPHSSVDLLQSAGQQLIDVTLGMLAMSSTQPVFEYDPMGNRLNTTEPGLAPFSSISNTLNQYSQVNGTSWHYDGNGNLRSDGIHSFLYDMNNALQEVVVASTNTNLVTYFRDALGRVVAESAPSGTIFRIHDGSLPLVEISATGRTEFASGHQPDRVLHAALKGEDYWLVYDGLTSMRMLSNGSADVVTMPLFRPFGEAEDNELALSPLRFGFASMWYTSGVPVYQSERRSYRPDVGRHLQRDPAGLADDLNPYTYARNNPINFSDPTGLKAEVEEPWYIKGLGYLLLPVSVPLYYASRGLEYLPRWVPGLGDAIYSAVGIATSPAALAIDLLSVPFKMAFNPWDEGFGHTYLHATYAKYLPGGRVASKVAGFLTEAITVIAAFPTFLPVVSILKDVPGFRDLWRSAYQLSDAWDNAQGRDIGSGAGLGDSIWDLVYEKIGTNRPGEGPGFARKYSALYHYVAEPNRDPNPGRTTFFGFFSDDRPRGWGPEMGPPPQKSPRKR